MNYKDFGQEELELDLNNFEPKNWNWMQSNWVSNVLMISTNIFLV